MPPFVHGGGITPLVWFYLQFLVILSPHWAEDVTDFWEGGGWLISM